MFAVSCSLISIRSFYHPHEIFPMSGPKISILSRLRLKEPRVSISGGIRAFHAGKYDTIATKTWRLPGNEAVQTLRSFHPRKGGRESLHAHRSLVVVNVGTSATAGTVETNLSGRLKNS